MNIFKAEDADEGLNAEIRYQILDWGENTPRFNINSVSGQIKAIANFAGDAERIYSFNVKATDRRGKEDGLFSIIRIIVRNISIMILQYILRLQVSKLIQ